MPEISDAQYREYVEYQTLGTPGEIRKKRTDLESDNFNQREEIRQLKEDRPAEGSVLLSPEDGQTHEEYKKLGTPSEIATRLEAGQQALKSLNQRDTRDSVVSFAKAAGLADAAVDTLIAIPTLENAKFEVRKQKQTDDKGKETEVEVPYVTLAGEGQKAMKFTDAEAQIPAMKGLLRATGGDHKPTGTEFVQQSPQSDEKPASKYEAIRNEEAAKKEARKKEADRATSVRERMGLTPA